jgi:hypothetical protein
MFLNFLSLNPQLMYKIYLFFLVVLFSSCLPKISYLGNSYAPTKEPDFFVDETSIERPYKIMGKGYPERFGSLLLETMQKKAVEKAKTKGADAVLIQDYYVLNTFTTANSRYRSDSLGKEIITTGNSVIANSSYNDTRFVILFLKYTDH